MFILCGKSFFVVLDNQTYKTFSLSLWWVDLGWMLGSHPAASSPAFWAGQGEENMMKEILTG